MSIATEAITEAIEAEAIEAIEAEEAAEEATSSRCDVCGFSFPSVEYFAQHGVHLCCSCREDMTCNYCGRVFTLSSLVRSHALSACHDCAPNHRCYRCRDLIEDGEEIAVETQYGTDICCPDCADDHTAHCERCNVRTDNSLLYDNGYCSSCYEEEEEEEVRDANEDENDLFTRLWDNPSCGMDVCGSSCSRYNSCDEVKRWIEPWSYKPRWITTYSGTERTDRDYLTAGIEIEMELAKPRNDLYENMYRKVKLAKATSDAELMPGHIFKNDASLNHGTEFVAHPKTRAYWTSQEGMDALKKLCELWFSHGFTGTLHTSGIHIHIDKRGLSQLDRIKLALMVYNNQPQIELFARRKFNSYCNSRNTSTNKLELGRDSERHNALSWMRQNTLELRVFQSSLRFSTVHAAIMVAYALVDYAQESTVMQIMQGWDRFVGWVADRSTDYPGLVDEMIKRNVFTICWVPRKSTKKVELCA